MKNRVLKILTAVVLTAALGRITYGNHIETWYNLPMQNITARADRIYGLNDVYAVNEDGIKTYNGFVIVAADKSIPYGTVVETSRGIGIVLDYHETESNVYDLAVSWHKEGKK